MNFNQLVQQAQRMQRKANKIRKEYEEKTFDFTSQQDAIKGTINGKLEITELHIDEKMLSAENKEMLEDLLIVSINEIIQKTMKEKEDTLNKATNGVDVSMFI